MFLRNLVAVTAACALCWSDANAEEAKRTPKPFPDFQAKRIKPPKRGATKRITIQIDPQAQTQAAPVASAVAQPGAAPAQSTLAWYWRNVSPDLKDSGPGRLEPALQALSKGPGGAAIPAPRLQTMQNIAAAHGVEILKASIGTEVSPALALAVIAVESSGRTDVVSSAGAQGLMQLMPATAERFGVTDRTNPAQNIKGGVAYLNFLMDKFDGDPLLVLAGYNAGENAVTKHDGVPPYKETREYVPKVLAAFKVARGLCLTPPELVTDGCVFRVSSN